MKNYKKLTTIISIIIILFLFIILFFYNNSKNRSNAELNSYENNDTLKIILKDILLNKFPERNINLDKVIQVEEYAAASWSDINSGGICFFINNNNNWQILQFGGGYPDSKYLVSEFGMSTNTAENLLDGVLPNWRTFQNSNNN